MACPFCHPAAPTFDDGGCRLRAEIARLQAEIRTVERAPPSFDEIWAATERQPLDAEEAFRRFGPQLDPLASPLPEFVHRRHLALVGASMVANGKALLDAERSRVKAATEGGLSAADKARKLDELRRAILKAAAKRELLVREIEGAEFMPRPVHPELLIYKQAEVERLAK